MSLGARLMAPQTRTPRVTTRGRLYVKNPQLKAGPGAVTSWAAASWTQVSLDAESRLGRLPKTPHPGELGPTSRYLSFLFSSQQLSSARLQLMHALPRSGR